MMIIKSQKTATMGFSTTAKSSWIAVGLFVLLATRVKTVNTMYSWVKPGWIVVVNVTRVTLVLTVFKIRASLESIAAATRVWHAENFVGMAC